MRRANESLSVLRQYDQQRRTRCEAWCEEWAGTAAGAGASRRARGVILSTGQLREKQGRVCERSGMEESEASRSAAETNCLDRSSYQQGTVVICIVSACLSPPASHVSHSFAVLAPAPRPALVVLYSFGEAHAARGLGHVERKKNEVRMILLHLYQPLSWPSHLLSMTTWHRDY